MGAKKTYIGGTDLEVLSNNRNSIKLYIYLPC